LVKNTAEDVNVTYFIIDKVFCQCCGMQLRTTPAERGCKEKVNGKKRERKRNLGLRIVSKSPWLHG
jgi:hypothetical protein